MIQSMNRSWRDVASPSHSQPSPRRSRLATPARAQDMSKGCRRTEGRRSSPTLKASKANSSSSRERSPTTRWRGVRWKAFVQSPKSRCWSPTNSTVSCPSAVGGKPWPLPRRDGTAGQVHEQGEIVAAINKAFDHTKGAICSGYPSMTGEAHPLMGQPRS